jgi:hypothetical protein
MPVKLETLSGYEPELYYCPYTNMRLVRRRYFVPESERAKVKSVQEFIMPDSGVMHSSKFFEIHPDWSVDHDPMKFYKESMTTVSSPFAIAPHSRSNTCPYYELFEPGKKLSNQYNAACDKPMLNGNPIVIANKQEKLDYLETIGGDELKQQFIASNDSYSRYTYCIWCFQHNYLEAYNKQLKKSEAAPAPTDSAASKYIQFRMIIASQTDYKSIIDNIMSQKTIEVAKYAYTKLNDTEVRGVYQTVSNNLIRKTTINKYYKGEFIQNRCLTMTDVTDVIGAFEVEQKGDWDSEDD